MGDQLKGGVNLFADLSGSTSLYETLGDVAASSAVRSQLDEMSTLVKDNDGQVIKTIGDAVHAWLPSADSAARAAIAIQKKSSYGALRVRVGFQYGEALHDTFDIFGDAVNVAARLASTARAGEILTTRETVSRLSKSPAIVVRDLGDERVKGKAQALHIFQVLWEEDETVVTSAFPPERILDQLPALANMAVLRLTFGRRKPVLTRHLMPYTFGRDRKVSLRLDSSRVSRNHAHLDFHHGKFVLVDHSTNGTFVTPEGGTEVRLQRESMPLLGRGVFSLGGSAIRNPDLSIQYALEN